ncbi:MAG: PASTA domain-containing protein [Actinomycetota bacterium]|nr:PASTA domain-containing protein [Actinomycetota bacterium]
MSIAEARAALRATHLRWTFVEHASPKPKGTVLEQALDPGTVVREHRSVRVVIAKPEPPEPCGVFGNPWCYTFESGSYISHPPADFCSYFDCISSFWSGSGYVIECQDGWFSKSGGISGSCSSHGGNWRYLYAA